MPSILNNKAIQTASLEQSDRQPMPSEVSLRVTGPPKLKVPWKWARLWTGRSSRSSEADSTTHDGIPGSPEHDQLPKSGQRQLLGVESNQVVQDRGLKLKEKSLKCREERRARTEEEKARKKFIGGVTWGFDPTAGTRRPQHQRHDNTDCATYTSQGQHVTRAEDDSDEMERLANRQTMKTDKFGIEYGGPGRDGKYGHGSLKTHRWQDSPSAPYRS